MLPVRSAVRNLLKAPLVNLIVSSPSASESEQTRRSSPSYTRRTREIGIRMALGAAPGKIRGIVPAGLVLARCTKSQLFGVEAFDAAVVVAAAWRYP